jgi:hypothetical protein
VAVLGACHQQSGTPAQPNLAPRPQVPAVARKGPTAEDLTAGMVEAAALGKSPLAVRLKFDLKQRPAIGKALEIDIAVMPQIDATAANIQVAGGDGLTVAPGANQVDMPALEAGQVYRQSIKATPTEEGVLVLNLTVSLKHDEITESRAFSIPLIVQR